jgi:hypothetical protein
MELTPNEYGEVIDRQCPECGAFASEHAVVMTATTRRGLLTLKEMRRERPDRDVLRCPR